MSPESAGEFDLVFSGSYLLHLMNPQLALANRGKITRGKAIIVDQFRPGVPREFMYFAGAAVDMCWWYYSIEADRKDGTQCALSRGQGAGQVSAEVIKGEMWHATFEALI